jgi:hypothetical protein
LRASRGCALERVSPFGDCPSAIGPFSDIHHIIALAGALALLLAAFHAHDLRSERLRDPTHPDA